MVLVTRTEELFYIGLRSPRNLLERLVSGNCYAVNIIRSENHIMRFLRNNGLTIVLVSAFLASMVGMSIAGYHHENQQLVRHGLPSISLGQYLTNANFLSALFENWESEWLQMATYVIFTAYLFQKGSAKSRS